MRIQIYLWGLSSPISLHRVTPFDYLSCPVDWAAYWQGWKGGQLRPVARQ